MLVSWLCSSNFFLPGRRLNTPGIPRSILFSGNVASVTNLQILYIHVDIRHLKIWKPFQSVYFGRLPKSCSPFRKMLAVPQEKAGCRSLDVGVPSRHSPLQQQEPSGDSIIPRTLLLRWSRSPKGDPMSTFSQAYSKLTETVKLCC